MAKQHVASWPPGDPAWVQAWINRGVAPDDILVLGLSRPTMESLTAWLKAEGIQASFLLTDQRPGGELDGRGDQEARRFLYIGMTRAREELCVSYHGESRLMEELVAAVSSRAPCAPPAAPTA